MSADKDSSQTPAGSLRSDRVATIWPALFAPAAVVVLAALAGAVTDHRATLAVGVGAATLPCVLVVFRITRGRRRLVALSVLIVVAALLLALGCLKLREISSDPPANPAPALKQMFDGDTTRVATGQTRTALRHVYAGHGAVSAGGG